MSDGAATSMRTSGGITVEFRHLHQGLTLSSYLLCTSNE